MNRCRASNRDSWMQKTMSHLGIPWFKNLCPTQPVRGQWNSQANFVVSLIGATTGLVGVIRFPDFIFKHEGSFLIAYVLIMLLIGIPLVIMELFLGQFTSTGPATCWEFSPLFRGVGISYVLLATVSNIYYQVFVGWMMFCFFKSFATSLPWKHCDREWASDLCLDFLNVSSAAYCQTQGWNVRHDGLCWNVSASPERITAMWNATLAAENGMSPRMPSVEYLTKYAVGFNKSGTDLTHLGQIHGDLVGCLLVVWLLIGLVLIWGISGLVKLMYFAVVYTFGALVIQLIKNVTIDGASDGLAFLFRVDGENFWKADLWMDAANLVFHSFALTSGTLVCLASFQTFKGDCFMYASLMAAGNFACIFLAGCIFFAAAGIVSKNTDIPISELGKGGFVFALYLHAFAQFSGSTFWSLLFFVMILTVGLSTAAVFVQTVLTSMMDAYPRLTRYKNIIIAALCALYFLLELPLVTDGGFYLIEIFEGGCYSFNVYLLAFLQCVSLAWVYGAHQFLVDISLMIGNRVCHCISWRVPRVCLCLSWTILCPVFTSYNTYDMLKRALWKSTDAEGALKLTLSCLLLVPVPVFAARCILRIEGDFMERLQLVARATKAWGPVCPKERNIWLAVHPITAGRDMEMTTGDPVENAGHRRLSVGFRPSIPMINLYQELSSSHDMVGPTIPPTHLPSYTEIMVPTLNFDRDRRPSLRGKPNVPTIVEQSEEPPPLEKFMDKSVAFRSSLEAKWQAVKSGRSKSGQKGQAPTMSVTAEDKQVHQGESVVEAP